MRQVIGRSTRELDVGAFAALREPYAELVVDLGTGDGKHVLVAARRRPSALVLGLDAAPDAMRATALSAARKPAKGGVPNAAYVWGSVEALPEELIGITEIHSLMPWGSLLRGLVAPSEQLLAGVAERCVPGAPFLITLNLHAWRPPVADVGDIAEPTPDTALDGLAARYARAGWTLDAADYLDAPTIAALGTSWTKRLGSTRDELAVLALRGRVG